jgi:hypothetical protein
MGGHTAYSRCLHSLVVEVAAIPHAALRIEIRSGDVLLDLRAASVSRGASIDLIVM